MKKILITLVLYIATTSICFSEGYRGKLPDIDKEFQYIRPTTSTTRPVFNATQDFVPEEKFKKVPRSNKSYIDIILKKDKSSPYLNDLNDVIPILEKMKKCIDSQGSVQKFNAIASSIIDHADYMNEKYKEKPERYYISFAKLMNIAAQARALATLRCEAQVYIKYLTTTGEGQIYNKDSINEQLLIFEEELENTIKILKDAT